MRGRRQYNVVNLLQKRQVLQPTSTYERRIASALSVRKIQLTDIAHQRLLLDSHVVLGFSRCGRLLLSYCNELDVTATQSTYTIYCWLFQGLKPLKCVCREPLFRGEPVSADLHLLVCQTPPPTHTVVVGCRKTCTEDFCRPCYISILPCFPPSTMTAQCSLHFKFDLMPPFPSFIPSLSLRVENCVVINSGDSVMALHYLVQSPQLPQRSSCGSKTYPAHSIPVDVYCEGRKVFDGQGTEQTCEQVSLDVELWINDELQSELTARGITYHSLIDYDLQLAEVCPGSGCAILVLVALLEAAPPLVTLSKGEKNLFDSISSTASPGSYSVEVIASWNIYKGTVECFQMSRLKPALPPSLMTGTRKWNPAAPIALTYRQKYSFLRSDTSVRAFSNHTVFSGKSLRCLHHPFLPISLTLLPSTLSSPVLSLH